MISADQTEWAPDDKETFRCYRQVVFCLIKDSSAILQFEIRLQDIADTLAYCYKFLRTTMMERLAAHLATTVSQCNVNPNDWPPLEACLHALKVF